jgi:hypothetical protein
VVCDLGVRFTPVEVAELVEASGFHADDIPSRIVEFGWSFPGWWSGPYLTELGSRFVGVCGVGLVFTGCGVRVVLDHFGRQG